MRGALTVANASAPQPPPPPPPPNPGSPGGPNPVDLLPKVAPAPLSASDWPFYGRDLSNTRTGGTDAPSNNEVPTLGPVWSFPSSDGDFTGTPVVAGGTLVAGSGGGTVFALDASTGALKWSRDLNQPINGSAAIANGRVYVPVAQVSSPRVVALNLADGSVAWDTTIDTQQNADVFGSPVVWNGSVFIGTSGENGEVNNPNVSVRGSVVSLDETTGALKWKTYTVPPGFTGGAVWDTPAIEPATGRVYVGTGNAYQAPAANTTDSVLALDSTTGAVLAHRQVTAGDVWNETSNITAGPDADFGSSPNLITGLDGRQLLGVGQKSGTYWAFDRTTLTPVWSALTGPPGTFLGGIVGSTAYDGQRVYGPDTPAGEIWALGRDGRLNWASLDGGPLHFSPVSAANGVVYTTDMTGTLTAREAITGAPLIKLPLGAPSWGGVSIAGGYVFAVTGTQGANGYVVAYRPRARG
jgi:polyvinyl alcohol dehydrogenase (cytochrome)